MKRILAIIIVLVLLVALAVPALAYTADELPGIPDTLDTDAYPYYFVYLRLLWRIVGMASTRNLRI